MAEHSGDYWRHDHEQRLRQLEREVSELKWTAKAIDQKLDVVMPKLDTIAQRYTLADRVESALSRSEENKWTRNERLFAVCVFAATMVNTYVSLKGAV